MKITAIPVITVTTNIPTLENVPAMSSTCITDPAIMKHTPTGVSLGRQEKNSGNH